MISSNKSEFWSIYFQISANSDKNIYVFLDEIEIRSDDWREATDLLVQLLQPNPKNRPHACQALEMAFFQDKKVT